MKMSKKSKKKPIEISDAKETARYGGAAADGETAIADELKTADESDGIESLRAELAEAKDKLLRARAEQQNLAKRMTNELSEAVRYANASLIKDLLETIDNFDRLVDQSAAADGDAEANLSALPNVTRLTGTVEETLPGLTPSPDVVVLDPPRVGITGSVIDALFTSAARRIVYVSCDPATLARDLRLLADVGFELTEVQPIDMFPQTQHIECVAILDRAGDG